jgi:2,3-dihydroxybiphenyl 1,2-dioxygenase
MQHELELAYLGIEVPDPATLTPFFAEVIGLVPSEGMGPTGTARWRNDSKAHRLIVQPGPANDATFLGFEAVDETSFESVRARLSGAGFPLTEGNDDDCTRRQVSRLVRTTAPLGLAVELVLGLGNASTPFSSPLMPGGFLTDGVGFGHVVLATTAFDESHAFFVDGLGFSQSDWLETEIAAGIELKVHFYHCNERHHTIALAKTPFALPQKLHHMMVETNDVDDVGAAFDRAWKSQLAIPNGLGRHPNDCMFSFYVTSPAGFRVEVGHGGRAITDDWNENRRYERISAWGHQPLR